MEEAQVFTERPIVADHQVLPVLQVVQAVLLEAQSAVLARVEDHLTTGLREHLREVHL